MRWITLATICSAVAFCVLLAPLLLHVQDLSDQYDTSAYVTASLWSYGNERYESPPGSDVRDKVIVMAALESEDVSWVAEELPEYEGSPPQSASLLI